VPAIAAQQIWFRRQSDTQPNENLVHAVMEDQREALCGEATIVYHLDETFTAVPNGAKVHDACREAVDKRNRL
jgi:hypothetical protein